MHLIGKTLTPPPLPCSQDLRKIEIKIESIGTDLGQAVEENQIWFWFEGFSAFSQLNWAR